VTARGRADVECLFGDSPRPEVSAVDDESVSNIQVSFVFDL